MLLLTDAKRHLRIDGPDHDTEVQQKLDLARAIVAQYVGVARGTPNPFAGTTEYPLTDELQALQNAENLRLIGYEDEASGTRAAAVLLVLGELWNAREAGTANPLSPGVRLLLDSIRIPGVA